MGKAKRRFILFLILTLLVVLFIFCNSMQDKAASGKRSGRIADALYTFLRLEGRIAPVAFHALVRKAAHAIEFCLLGFCLTCTARYFAAWRQPFFFCTGVLLASLAMAVADEFLQEFTGRTSSVRDVLIDFSGSVAGFLLALIVFAVLRRGKDAKK